MQYQFPLLPGVDVDSMRRGIPEVGALFDEIPGLGIKAFLLREKGVAGSPVSQYAPFYLWSDVHAAAEFLYGGTKFGAVVGAYGRPLVQTWIGGTYHLGEANDLPVTHAVRTLTRVPSNIDPKISARAARERILSRLDEPGLHSAAWSIDPHNWELMTIALHNGAPKVPDGGELYEVPYLSAPDRLGLPSVLG